MSLQLHHELHPTLRALGAGVGGLVLLVGGSLAAYSGLRALAQAGAPAPPAPVATTPAAQNYIADPAAGRGRVGLLAAQSHGDWSHLSAADQAMLDSMTAGHGHEMFRDLVRHYNAQKRSARNVQPAKD